MAPTSLPRGETRVQRLTDAADVLRGHGLAVVEDGVRAQRDGHHRAVLGDRRQRRGEHRHHLPLRIEGVERLEDVVGDDGRGVRGEDDRIERRRFAVEGDVDRRRSLARRAEQAGAGKRHGAGDRIEPPKLHGRLPPLTLWFACRLADRGDIGARAHESARLWHRISGIARRCSRESRLEGALGRSPARSMVERDAGGRCGSEGDGTRASGAGGAVAPEPLAHRPPVSSTVSGHAEPAGEFRRAPKTPRTASAPVRAMRGLRAPSPGEASWDTARNRTPEGSVPRGQCRGTRLVRDGLGGVPGRDDRAHVPTAGRLRAPRAPVSVIQGAGDRPATSSCASPAYPRASWPGPSRS